VSSSADLTPNQMQAVDHFRGPLLVLAGPGSGKTRVITRRIARLIERGVNPREILAITFTNKAADEMGERVKELVPQGRVWVSTFHRFCARLLRSRAEIVGLGANFSIFDTTDQRQLLREVLRDLNIDAVHFSPNKVAHRISNAKNNLQSAADVARSFDDAVGNHLDAVVSRVYPVYQRRLMESNAVDFDDLLLHVVKLLSENPELRHSLDERYRYVLVDEYQDTNPAQYRIVAALSQDFPNLCVTGDPDQSIYGWRGARIDNILRFESDYPSAVVVRLEENFRSTQQILKTADSLIAHNVLRKQKRLVTDNPDGEPVELVVYRDGEHEADEIARDMRRQVEAGERAWSDFGILYRVNALSREIEFALLRHRVPYQIASGVEFYERAEIKDTLAYLKLISNPADRIAFLRVVNTPRRGIGKTSIAKLVDWAERSGVSLVEAAGRVSEIPGLPKKAGASLKKFAELIADCRQAIDEPVDSQLARVLERTGYLKQWQGSDSEQDQQRLANVQELRTAAQQFDDARADEATLEGFLETVSLVSSGDNLDNSAGCVTLMTLHAAKGLEFPVVYLVGLEHNLIPHERALRTEDNRELEEERRLLFVGITRAQDRLFLTQTQSRNFRGRRLTTIPSEFVSELKIKWSERTESDWPTDTDFESNDSGDIDDWGADNSSAPSRLRRTKPPSDRAETPAKRSGFSAGMLVRHPQYGIGTVIRVSGPARKQTVTVGFEDAQEAKTFVSDHCPLQPVGTR
jgi:DNA helicase II / ATP-dependent DNA helicase PcrA